MSASLKPMNERADEIELQQMQELDERIVARSMLYCLAAGEDSMGPPVEYGPGAHLMMGEDPRLKKMPENPGLLDFFRLRLSPGRGFQRVKLEQFEDVIGRNFRQPKEGLGNDNSPASHMWRTLRRPSNAL